MDQQLAVAFDWIERHVNQELDEIGGLTYTRGPRGVTLVKPPEPAALTVNTLTALATFLLSGDPALALPGLIHVEDHARVRVYRALHPQTRERLCVLSAVAWPAAENISFPEETLLNQASFLLHAQTCFVDDEERARLLKVVGTMKQAKEHTSEDDGVTQQVAASAGLRLGMVNISNPFTLRPWCTFGELEQPARTYVLRAQGGSEEAPPSVLLAEIPDPRWKEQAAARVADWITDCVERLVHDSAAGDARAARLLILR